MSQTLLLPSENTDNKLVRILNSYPRKKYSLFLYAGGWEPPDNGNIKCADTLHDVSFRKWH